MLREFALVLLGVLVASDLKNYFRDDKVKVYLLLAQTGEGNTLVPVEMPSDIPENISLKDLLSYVPANYKINVAHLGTAPETGVSANIHNYSDMMEENASHVNKTQLHQFTNKTKHLSENAVTENRSMINNSLAETVDLENDTKDELEENDIFSNISQRVILKILHSRTSVKSDKMTPHSLQDELSIDNETITNQSSIFLPQNNYNNSQNTTKIHVLDALISGNVSNEEVYRNHDIKDVYYVVHTCSQKRCQIHQVVVLKRGTVQEEDMEEILQTSYESETSPHKSNGWLNEWQELFSDILNCIFSSDFRNIQWLLPAILSLSAALITKVVCDVYTYKNKVDMTYLYMEESISDMREMADILKNYTTAQLILERRILLACNKESDNESQIEDIKDEIAHLKTTMQSMNGCNTVNMDDFVGAVLNYLQSCLETETDSITDRSSALE